MQGILLGLADVLDLLLRTAQILIFVSAILSWVSADPSNPIVRGIRVATDPSYGWLRKRMPFLVQGGLDLSPLAAILICIFLDRALVLNLRLLAAGFQ